MSDSYESVIASAVARYNGDANGDGTPDADDVQGSHDGTWLSTPEYTTPPATVGGNAFRVSSSNYIDTDAVISGAGARTFACWFKTTQTAAALFSMTASGSSGATGTRWSFVVAGGYLRIEVQGGGYTAITLGTVNDNEWHFAAITFSGITLADHTIYLNGVAQPASGSTAINTTATNGRLGEQYALLSTGAVDIANAILFSRALSEPEVAELLNGPEPIYSGSGVTLSQTGVVDVDESNWDDRGNGGLTFDVAVHVNDVETEVINDYAGGSVLEGLSLTSGDEVYVVVRALNNGDDDPAQNQTSNTIVYSSGLAAKYHHYRQLMSA